MVMRFYTFPPDGIEYPFLLVNPRNYKALFRRKFEHAILDCGVVVFEHNPGLTDYPRNFLERWKRMAKWLTKIFGDRLWVTIPDYPDDYHPGQFGDNVAKTIRNIEEFIAVDGVNWLPVIQSRFLDTFSFIESCGKVRELVGDYPRVAIGTVCKTKNLRFIKYCCETARAFFPKSWIHAFGLTLNALPHVKDVINSFDSLAYTFPRGRGKASCKNIEERKQYFYRYIECMRKIVEEKSVGRGLGYQGD